MPLKLTSELVSAYVAHNPVPASEIETLLRAVHHAFLSLANGEPGQEPSVAINGSVANDYLVCLEDGKRLKMLKRYLRSRYGMTPEAYRAKWKLPSDYPMTAPPMRRGGRRWRRKPDWATTTHNENPRQRRRANRAPHLTENNGQQLSRHPQVHCPVEATSRRAWPQGQHRMCPLQEFFRRMAANGYPPRPMLTEA